LEIETLNWDSGFFGIKIGKVYMNDSFNFAAFREAARKNQFDLVYVFREIKSTSIEVVLPSDFHLIDILVTMTLDINIEAEQVPVDFNTSLSPGELGECYEIAESIAKVSRFYREPLIGKEKALKLYRKWVDNSLNGSFCDGVIVNRSEGHIRGIHLIKTDPVNHTGTCSLIGTHPFNKGAGIGRDLWKQAFSYWIKKNNVTLCRVPFSLENMESFNFHLRIGFNNVESIRYIYHYRKEL
jgi:dTDP-4-amino-4,6-dideoxy-D-galactose acyltransferase